MRKTDPLAELLEDGVIDAVHTRLMSGKEATVFVVERGGHLGAAKVYKSRNDRTFKNVASYIEGRNQTRNTRDRRAMAKKSGYGRELMEEGWQDMEFRALRRAFDAGVLVPEPFFVFPSVLLMELVVDNTGTPASRLADFPYSPEQATLLHQEVFMQVKALLAAGMIHGDLSAYNILMSARGATLIDIPQIVDAAGNTNAKHILRRDLKNITEHLARYDARLQRFSDCGLALFDHYERGTLDMVTGPEASAPQWRDGGRRARDAERGRAGRDKSGGRGPAPPRFAAHADLGAPKPAGDRPPERQRPPRGPGDRPARPHADRPARPHADRPARPHADRPARPHADRPARAHADRAPRSPDDRPAHPPVDRAPRVRLDRPAHPPVDRAPRAPLSRPARPPAERAARTPSDRARTPRPTMDPAAPTPRPRGRRPGTTG